MTTTYEKQIKMGIYWSSFIIVLLAWYSLFQSMWSLLEIDGIWGIIALAWGLIWFMWLVYTLFMKWKNDSDNLIIKYFTDLCMCVYILLISVKYDR